MAMIANAVPRRDSAPPPQKSQDDLWREIDQARDAMLQRPRNRRLLESFKQAPAPATAPVPVPAGPARPVQPIALVLPIASAPTVTPAVDALGATEVPEVLHEDATSFASIVPAEADEAEAAAPAAPPDDPPSPKTTIADDARQFTKDLKDGKEAKPEKQTKISKCPLYLLWAFERISAHVGCSQQTAAAVCFRRGLEILQRSLDIEGLIALNRDITSPGLNTIAHRENWTKKTTLQSIGGTAAVTPKAWRLPDADIARLNAVAAAAALESGDTFVAVCFVALLADPRWLANATCPIPTDEEHHADSIADAFVTRVTTRLTQGRPFLDRLRKIQHVMQSAGVTAAPRRPLADILKGRSGE